MIRPYRPLYSLGVLVATLFLPTLLHAQDTLRVASPDGRNAVTVGVRDGIAYYAVERSGKHVILPSRLGFTFRGARSLGDSVRVTTSCPDTSANRWGRHFR